MPNAGSFYDLVGGEPTFRKLVNEFYSRVATDPLLRHVYPEEDLGPATERLTLFLMQYWGGPHTYSQQRGHPRLRMRHAPFPIGPAERDAWLHRMREALDTLELPAAQDARLWEYFTHAAQFLVNRPPDADPPHQHPPDGDPPHQHPPDGDRPFR